MKVEDIEWSSCRERAGARTIRKNVLEILSQYGNEYLDKRGRDYLYDDADVSNIINEIRDSVKDIRLPYEPEKNFQKAKKST